jgi:hypothetical protein
VGKNNHQNCVQKMYLVKTKLNHFIGHSLDLLSINVALEILKILQNKNFTTDTTKKERNEEKKEAKINEIK